MDAEIASEATIHELQARIEELERLHEADQLEVRSLRQSEEEASSLLRDSKAQGEQLKQQAVEHKEAARVAHNEREQIDIEKRELLDALSRSDSDRANVEGELCPALLHTVLNLGCSLSHHHEGLAFNATGLASITRKRLLSFD